MNEMALYPTPALRACQGAWADLEPSARAARFLALPNEKQQQAFGELAETAAYRDAIEVALAEHQPIPSAPLSWLPDPPKKTTGRPRSSFRDSRWDQLKNIEPAAYVERITGEEVPRSGFIGCPFPGHQGERTASFKVYETAERGVYCHACHRGGDIYNFAQIVWEVDFKEAKARLLDLFGLEDDYARAAA